ncbi:hypothetical protein ACIRVF_39770 [Kitasatospora sp. NPDC101157]|uniref:hypothetical protein n=1 Tax=Kitasatospora sp. NPDC101157 TaxID=3364098 RepID=UPI0038112CFF
MENAELGNLTDRARQAVLLSREGASPVQVAAADHLLEQDPFGPAALFTEIDPTAATVAAAHWLAAAAEVASEASGHSPAAVLVEADNIEALPHETPTLVLQLIEAGASPYDMVTRLLGHALHVADGLLPDPAGLREQLDDIDDTLAQHTDPEDTGLRLTPLDPRRPARDLVEDLVTGIRACWLLHTEYDDLDDEDDDTSAEDWSDEQAEQHQQRSRARFAQLVRETAAHRDPLICPARPGLPLIKGDPQVIAGLSSRWSRGGRHASTHWRRGLLAHDPSRRSPCAAHPPHPAAGAADASTGAAAVVHLQDRVPPGFPGGTLSCCGRGYRLLRSDFTR